MIEIANIIINGITAYFIECPFCINKEKPNAAYIQLTNNAHHYKQNANGPIVLMPSKHHDKPHTNPGQHPFGKRKGGGLTKTEREAFNNWRKEFYADLAEKELNKRGVKVKCYG